MASSRQTCPGGEALCAYALDSATDRGVNEHLAGCPECRAVVDGFNRDSVALAAAGAVSLPAALDFDRVKTNFGWAGSPPGTQQEAGETTRRFWWRVPWLVPVVLAAGTVLIAVGGGVTEGPAPARLFADLNAAQEIYVRAIDALQDSVHTTTAGEYLDRRDPVVEEVMRAALEDIDDIIRRCRHDLRGAPQNVRRHRLLLAAYQRKVEMLDDLLEFGALGRAPVSE